MERRDPTLLIRKLRKKLRQIEHLEHLERDLTDEELSKCIKKDVVRDQLLQLLADTNQNSSSVSITPSIDIDPNSSFSVSTDLSTSISTSEIDLNLPVSQCIGGGDADNSEVSALPFEKQETRAVKYEVQKGNPSPEKHKPDRSQEPSRPQQQAPAASSTEFKQPSPAKKSKKVPKEAASGKLGVSDQWRSASFEVTALDSHSDLVTAVDSCGSLLVSASRDTTVKIWDIATLTELKSLGSHTGSVTDVVIIPAKDLPSVGESLGVGDDDHLVFSGSVDCSIKVWSAKTGELLRDIYTYNPITKLAFCRALSRVVTASDGGKLEVWDIESKESVVSERAHGDAITGLCVNDKKICTSCANEGEIKLFEIRDQALHCIYASENVRNVSGATVAMRPVRALNFRGDNLFYGDDGVNVKILSWKKGIVKKIPNHREEFGMTDTICFHSNLMFTSAYDLDTGQGYVNVFDVTSEPVYVTSLLCEDTRRILDICCVQADGDGTTFVTAGLDLLVWRKVAVTRTNAKDLIPSKFLQELSQFAQDSDIESEVEFTESEDEGPGGPRLRRGSRQSQGGGGWGSWCSLL